MIYVLAPLAVTVVLVVNGYDPVRFRDVLVVLLGSALTSYAIFLFR